MMLKRWDDLPAQMRTPAVRPYYDALAKKRGSLIAKRIFDIGAALVLLILLSQSNPQDDNMNLRKNRLMFIETSLDSFIFED